MAWTVSDEFTVIAVPVYLVDEVDGVVPFVV
jgi:hypothetical protein